MPLSDLELERYSRQLVLARWGEREQLALRDANVGVIGAGALGSPVALYLAAAGVGRIGIVDPDEVELSNLHRQILHFTPDVGVPKAHSAAAKLRFLNPEVHVEPYQVEVTPINASVLLGEFALVVDCTDSFATRYAVNAGACALGASLVTGGVLALSGLVLSVRPGETACYRCLFPSAPADPASCASAGILGPAAGVVGSLMALEAIRLLAGGPGEPTVDGFLQMDLDPVPSFTRVSGSRRPDCPDCGRLPSGDARTRRAHPGGGDRPPRPPGSS